jgi:hypothetical protein
LKKWLLEVMYAYEREGGYKENFDVIVVSGERTDPKIMKLGLVEGSS